MAAWTCPLRPCWARGWPGASSPTGTSAVLAARYPHVPNLGDITALDWAAVPPVDLITAGWPCQDISYAGPGAGIEEGTRSGLWLTIADGLGRLRPSYVSLHKGVSGVSRYVVLRKRSSGPGMSPGQRPKHGRCMP